MNPVTKGKEPDHANVNEMGIVISPKRWRGHPVYVIYYWALCVRYSWEKRQRDPIAGERFKAEVWDTERKVWPALSGIEALTLELLENGRVRVTELTQKGRAEDETGRSEKRVLQEG